MSDQDQARTKLQTSAGTEVHPADDQETGGRNGANFDPTPYLRQLRGRGGSQEYLDVKWRLLWLRREHPDAEIVTEHVRIDDTSAIFKATVTLPGGGKATGYGSETAGDFGDFIEKAETKAIGRALNALGYGAQFAEESEDPAAPGPRSVAPAPREPRPEAASSPPSRPAAPADAPRQPARTAAAPIEPSRPAAPIDFAAGRDRGTTPTAPPAPNAGRPASRSTASPPAAADEPNMADFTPTVFWRWAREQGLDRAGVEQLIGRPVAGLTPADLRRLVLEAQARNEP